MKISGGYKNQRTASGAMLSCNTNTLTHSGACVTNLGKSRCNILKQKWFYLQTRTKLLKIKDINQENPENHLNFGIKSEACDCEILRWNHSFSQKNPLTSPQTF
jgi:hypothetical protein